MQSVAKSLFIMNKKPFALKARTIPPRYLIAVRIGSNTQLRISSPSVLFPALIIPSGSQEHKRQIPVCLGKVRIELKCPSVIFNSFKIFNDLNMSPLGIQDDTQMVVCFGVIRFETYCLPVIFNGFSASSATKNTNWTKSDMPVTAKDSWRSSANLQRSQRKFSTNALHRGPT